MSGPKKLDPLNIKIGQRLKELRKLNGLTGEQIAKRIKVTRTTICNMEAGRQNFMVYNIVDFAKAYKIPVHKLFEWLMKAGA